MYSFIVRQATFNTRAQTLLYQEVPVKYLIGDLGHLPWTPVHTILYCRSWTFASKPHSRLSRNPRYTLQTFNTCLHVSLKTMFDTGCTADRRHIFLPALTPHFRSTQTPFYLPYCGPIWTYSFRLTCSLTNVDHPRHLIVVSTQIPVPKTLLLSS